MEKTTWAKIVRTKKRRIRWEGHAAYVGKINHHHHHWLVSPVSPTTCPAQLNLFIFVYLVISGSLNSLYNSWLYLILHIPVSCTASKIHLRIFFQIDLMIIHLWIAPRCRRRVLLRGGNNSNKNIVENPWNKETFRRHGCRWNYNIKINFQEPGCEGLE